ncbi:hypothetical protein V3O24_02920 [Methylobacter sp. Wu8]
MSAALPLRVVGAGHARDEGATTLYRSTEISRALPAPTLLLYLT